MPKPDPTKLAADHYFHELEDILVRRLHREANSDEGRAALLSSTGIDDPTMIDELAKLGVTADALVAMRLFPLVLVAWAEEHADRAEHDAVLKEARKIGVQEDSPAGVLLDSWLKRRPGGMGVDAWKRYAKGVFSRMKPEAARQLIEQTEAEMIAVAKATGGHLGFGKISKKERLMIERLVEIMKHDASLK